MENLSAIFAPDRQSGHDPRYCGNNMIVSQWKCNTQTRLDNLSLTRLKANKIKLNVNNELFVFFRKRMCIIELEWVNAFNKILIH